MLEVQEGKLYLLQFVFFLAIITIIIKRLILYYTMDKFSALNNTCLLYKAASGILRVKEAMDLPGFDTIHNAIQSKLDSATTPTFTDIVRNKFLTGQALAKGYNGKDGLYLDNDVLKNKHSNKSRMRQVGAIGIQGLGGIGGALGGLALSKKLVNKLGLDKDEYDSNGKKKKKSLLKRLAKIGLIGGGAIAGGLGGYGLGAIGSGFLGGGNKQDNRYSAILTRPKVNKGIKDTLNTINSISPDSNNPKSNKALNNLVDNLSLSVKTL